MSRLLVVEDDNSVRNTVVTFLELEGYDGGCGLVHARSSGALAQNTIRSLFPISTWMSEPGLTFWRPRAGTNPNCAVILMTGRGTMETVMRATQGGAFDYIAKPFELDRCSKR